MIKVGLVLSGGGARGFAQIGVLKVLKKNDVKIDAIAGCSIGAMVGACYAYDQNPDNIEQLLMKIIHKRDIYDFSFSTKGLIKGEKLSENIAEYFKKDKKPGIDFEDLKIPLAVNATDIVIGEEIIFDKGPLVPAIMASLSYPGFFTTRKVNDKICVDGGVLNPLPISLLKGMDYLILVDVSEGKKDINEDSNFKDVVLQATLVMQKKIVEKSISECKTKYFLIRPDVEHTGVLDFRSDVPSLIKKGETTAELHIKNIKDEIDALSKHLISTQPPPGAPS